LRALETLVNQILGIDAPEASAYNPAQSTHTASVHRTISVSAEKLMFSYGHLNLETKLAQLEVEIRALEDSSFKIMAAKRALSRLIARDYLFTDSSGVSTRQLLGLVYCAILDNTKRKGSLLDAKKLLIDALYEIQRGYNLNAAGVDDNQSDRPICVAGTFNKLVSILMGIHPDVELRYVTTTAAAAKLPIVVQRHLLNYLKSLASSVNTQTKCLDVMKTIQADGHLESIWKELIKGVEAEIWDEFKEAYQENRTHRDFLDLLANGVWSPLPDLKVIDDKLKPALQTATGLFASSAVSEQKEELKPSLSIA
jgi:hypothetical protein